MSTLNERWADLEDLMAEFPTQPETPPRWKKDNLAGYGGKPGPTLNTETPEPPAKDVIKQGE